MHDLAKLHALDCPAALMTPADCNLLATNEQFDRALPGASEHGNLIKWLLLDERARRVLPEPYWTRETHQLVGTLHCLWPTFVPRPRLGVLLSDLVDAPEFQRFWFTPTETVEDPSNSIQLRDFKTGDVAEHYRQTSQPEPPQPRTWRLFKLTPKLPDRGGSPQQELFHLDD